jgi:hypothetical protein
VGVVRLGRGEAADAGELGGHFDGGVHDGGEPAAVGAVGGVIGVFAVLRPACADGEVLLWLEALGSVLLLVRGELAVVCQYLKNCHGGEELTLVSTSWSGSQYRQTVSAEARSKGIRLAGNRLAEVLTYPAHLRRSPLDRSCHSGSAGSGSLAEFQYASPSQ